MLKRLTIVADDRERASGVVERLAAMAEVDLVVRRLKAGDYEIGSRALVERKTVADFAASVVDGRVFAQAVRLNDSGLRPLLLLEGSPQAVAELGVRREALQGAMLSLSLVFGIPVIRSIDAAESARLLIYAAGQLAGTRGPTRLPRRGGKSLDARRIQLLGSLPGVGHARAKLLLEAFGSVERCLGASVEELEAVKGVGRRTAEMIRSVVAEPEAPYGKPVSGAASEAARHLAGRCWP